MWIVSVAEAGFSIAARGETSTGLPSTRVKPAGLFIHALAVTTKTPERIPPMATSTPEARWRRGETRSQPYR